MLVLKTGIQLIDAFGVKFGEQLPGWTPSWSAPEQVRGEPVTGTADVYPLALMAARILGGEVVGEVRKYRTLRHYKCGSTSHNPSLYIDRDRGWSVPMASAQRDLVDVQVSILSDGTSASDFADEMRALFDAYPIADTVTLSPTVTRCLASGRRERSGRASGFSRSTFTVRTTFVRTTIVWTTCIVWRFRPAVLTHRTIIRVHRLTRLPR